MLTRIGKHYVHFVKNEMVLTDTHKLTVRHRQRTKEESFSLITHFTLIFSKTVVVVVIIGMYFEIHERWMMCV